MKKDSSEEWLCLSQNPTLRPVEVIPALLPAVIDSVKDKDLSDQRRSRTANGKVITPRLLDWTINDQWVQFQAPVSGYSWIGSHYMVIWRIVLSAQRSTDAKKAELVQVELWHRTEQVSDPIITFRFLGHETLGTHYQIKVTNAAGRLIFTDYAAFERHLDVQRRFAKAMETAAKAVFGPAKEEKLISVRS